MGEAINRRRRRGRLLLCATLLWMVLIFCFSAQNATNSSALSGGLLEKLLAVVSPYWRHLNSVGKVIKIQQIHTLFRKLGHFTEYAVLGMLCTLTARHIGGERMRSIWCALLAAGLSLLYAAGDELHQRFVPGRYASLADVLLDTCGGVFGMLCMILAGRIYRSLSS